ncbi:MAG: class I SAM-dependent methyltransferase [Bdellovibrionota bacterium]
MQNRSCTICASPLSGWEYTSSLISVWHCASCGHRGAEHPQIAPTTDYYEHTPTKEKFVNSLLQTRQRQARLVLDRLVPLLDEGDGWLDFGCGRGPFLEEAKTRGLRALGGYETSALSKSWLTERGFSMAESRAGESFWPDWASLSFAPKVVSLFDVLEHFPGEQALHSVRRMVAELPDLKWIVIKVPVSDGILFRIANGLKGLAPGPYNQLFQAGTFPPHFHYFSRASLGQFLKKAGLEATLIWDDSDLDNLFHRIPSLDFLPGGKLAARFLGAFPGDTRVICAKVIR